MSASISHRYHPFSFLSFFGQSVFLGIGWIIVGGTSVGFIGFTGSCSRSVKFGAYCADCAITRARSHSTF